MMPVRSGAEASVFDDVKIACVAFCEASDSAGPLVIFTDISDSDNWLPDDALIAGSHS